jgi:hypothetical protein
LGRRLQGACEIIALFALTLAVVLGLVLLVVGLNGYTDWAPLPRIIQIFAYLAAFGFVTLFAARIASLGLGWIGMLAGTFLYYNPLIFAFMGSHLGFTADSPFFSHLFHVTPALGLFILICSVVQLMIAHVYSIIHTRQLMSIRYAHGFETRETPEEAGAAAGIPTPHPFLTKCWDMYACPDGARQRCPNFLDKIPCWKRRRGCLCDHRLPMYLYQSKTEGLAGFKVNPQFVTDDITDTLADYAMEMRNAKPRTWAAQQVFCHNCSLFLEHQWLKYRSLNWIFLPVSVVMAVVLYPWYHLGYNYWAQAMDLLSHRLAAYLPEGFYSDAGILVNSPYEYVLYAVLTILLMSYVVEYTDRCFLEWKW